MMTSYLLALVFLLIVHADFTYSKVHYITPSWDGPCPQNSSCLTISQFAANSRDNETDISLLFLPGNHTLSRELLLVDLDKFSMTKDGLDNETVFVHCPTHLGRFEISQTDHVSIKNLHFIGCGSNSVSHVKRLTITHSTFQGVQDNYTVLAINDISAANIVNSSFLSNRLKYFHSISENIDVQRDVEDYVYHQRNITSPSGVLHSAFSNVSIVNSKFIHNKGDIGGALVAYKSSLYIAKSSFSNNIADFGAVMVTSGSTIDIDNSTFNNNEAKHSGVVMVSYSDAFSISSTNFTNNSAGTFGGVMMTFSDSSFDINNCTFTQNGAGISGGVMEVSSDSSFSIMNSSFIQNSAYSGGVISTTGNSSSNFSKSTFTGNNVESYGGVMVTLNNSTSIFSNCIFTHNNAAMEGGGVVATYDDSYIIISNNNFTDNSARYGGAIAILHGSSLYISSNTFVNNKAYLYGAVFACINLKSTYMYTVVNSYFSSNAVSNQGGGVIATLKCSLHIINCTFNKNNGSLYTFNSNLTFSGYSKIESGLEPLLGGSVSILVSQEGGAITSFQSTVIFTKGSSVHFSNNRATHGGAILATESTITIYGETVITNSMATMANSSGGGISLRQSRLEIKGNCQIVNNSAMRGGGIHVSSSSIAVYQSATLQVIGNSAELGGGIYLEVNPKVYILKTMPELRYLINLTNNHANYGGAVYVADDTNSGACSPNNECFVQILSLYILENVYYPKTVNILFSENTVSEQGANLFGGLLDRCIPSQFAEVYDIVEVKHYSGVTYFGNITSNITMSSDSISSQPVRVCFCNSVHEPDCSYQPPTIRVEKGKTFNVSLVAVDQVNHTVRANISSSLTSFDGGFGEGQQTQTVQRNHCSNLTFNVFSPHDFETINLYPEGPCGSVALSTSHLTVQFINCTCPVGFESLSSSQSSTRCECDCDSKLSPYITGCDVATNSVFRKGTNSWITYINDTDQPAYVIYPNCPFDYCHSLTENVTINFNRPKGADSQCAYNRTGLLCGACKDNLSLSLASSRCLPCHTHWPAVFVVILLAAAIAGILLVTALLTLNMTVSVGLINGFIFYANIVSAGSHTFFPSSEPSFPSVFVAWLNLDIGIDVCFIDGLDAYTKTWLQLAFPVYIISLVVVVIIVSEYSPRFAGLIGKRDPVSTLSTLILLSYAKLLSITITALSYAVLHYPDGKQETVWLPDGNVPYFQGKHIPLVLIALLIIIVGLPYTISLFLWQWIVHAPRWKIFRWTRNTKLNAFIATHHVPHNSKYRYWTGLLLIVRVVLYITASVTVSTNPQTILLISGILIGGLLLFSKIFSLRVYKNSFVDSIETVLYFNLLALALFSLYDFKTDITKQTAVAYTSTIITSILFIVVICYHVSLDLLNTKEKRLKDITIEYPLVPVQAAKAEETQSVIELPKSDQDQPSADKVSDEPDIIEDII